MRHAPRAPVAFPWALGFLLGALLTTSGPAGAVASCHAYGRCDNTSPDGYYFSGTAAHADCRWSAGTGDTLTKVQAFVNGVKIYESTFAPPGPMVFPPQYNPDLKAAYSTTQFGNGTQLHFKACLWTTNGVYKETTDSAVHYARNRGYALTNDDPGLSDFSGQRATAAGSFMTTAHHTPTLGQCNKATITGTAIPRSTFYHITTHGTSDSVGDSYARDGGDPNHWIAAADVTAAVANKGQSDCRLNFVFLDACDTGDIPGPIRGPWNAVSFVGWNGDMWDNQAFLTFVQEFYGNLGAQQAVVDAVNHAKQAPGAAQNAQWFGVGSYKVHLTY